MLIKVPASRRVARPLSHNRRELQHPRIEHRIRGSAKSYGPAHVARLVFPFHHNPRFRSLSPTSEPSNSPYLQVCYVFACKSPNPELRRKNASEERTASASSKGNFLNITSQRFC